MNSFTLSRTIVSVLVAAALLLVGLTSAPAQAAGKHNPPTRAAITCYKSSGSCSFGLSVSGAWDVVGDLNGLHLQMRKQGKPFPHRWVSYLAMPSRWFKGRKSVQIKVKVEYGDDARSVTTLTVPVQHVNS
jgi:hypothetical protein